MEEIHYPDHQELTPSFECNSLSKGHLFWVFFLISAIYLTEMYLKMKQM